MEIYRGGCGRTFHPNDLIFFLGLRIITILAVFKDFGKQQVAKDAEKFSANCFIIIGGVRIGGKRKIRKSRSEELVVGLRSAFLFLARKREALPRVEPGG